MNNIKELIIECYNYCFLNDQLSQDQQFTIINLIPQKDKDIRYLKNWKHVSLLNTDYKILTKALAQKLQKAIGTIVNEDQVGCIKGRYIGETIRTTEDVMSA